LDGVQFPDDIVKANPLDVFTFFAAAGLTPEWIGRLREFAIEYLASCNLAPELPGGLIAFYQLTHEPLPQDALEALHLVPLEHPPALTSGSTDVAMGSGEDEVDEEGQGGEGTEMRK
jgi:hypothetical protein